MPGRSMRDTILPKGRANRYHERSPRACDECKLRKKKCDGKQPCHSCKLHEKECTYESRTRPSQPPTQRIRELEENIRSVRDLLRGLKPDLSNNKLTEVQRMLDTLQPAAEESLQTLSSPNSKIDAATDAIKSMLVGRGRLLQSENRTFFHGPYSGPAVICAVLEFFKRTDTEALYTHVTELFHLAGTNSNFDIIKTSLESRLPERSEAVALFDVVIMQSHPFLQFVDPTILWNVLESSYKTHNSKHVQLADGDLALCHIVLALGWSLDLSQHRTHGCDWAVSQALLHYALSRQLLDLTKVDDLTQLQATLCTVVFLISQSRLSSAYTYIGVASASAIKQGFHISPGLGTPSDKVQRQTKTLTTLVNIDLYVSSVLGLPPLVNIDTAGTTFEATREPASYDQMGSQGWCGHQNARRSLQVVSSDLPTRFHQVVSLAASVLFELSAVSANSTRSPAAVAEVDITLLQRAERDLTTWTRVVGTALPPSAPDGDDVPARASVTKHELELSLYWAQLLLYLPFLHYLRPLADGHWVPDSLSRPALTCLKIAVNTIVCCDSLLRTLSYSEAYRYFMHPSNWTCIYTTFLAVIALIFLISVHGGTSKPTEAWRKAEKGIKILAALRCCQGGASPCLAIIKELVRQLNHTVDFNIEEIERTTPTVCQRWVGQGGHVTTIDSLIEDSPGVSSSSSVKTRGMQMSSDNQHLGPELAETDTMSSADAMLATAQHVYTTNDTVVNPST